MPTQNLMLFGERCLVEVCFTIGYMFQLWGNLPHSIRYRILFTEAIVLLRHKGTELTKLSSAESVLSLINPLNIVGDFGSRLINPFQLFHRVRSQLFFAY